MGETADHDTRCFRPVMWAGLTLCARRGASGRATSKPNPKRVVLPIRRSPWQPAQRAGLRFCSTHGTLCFAVTPHALLGSPCCAGLVAALAMSAACEPSHVALPLEPLPLEPLPLEGLRPLVPSDNPLSAEKVELGRHLFYDRGLSSNREQACATCHRQELAFTDGMPYSVGSTGEPTPRSAPSLANVAYASTLTWANPRLRELEEQALLPLFGTAPVELGFTSESELLERLGSLPRYEELFAAAFPRQPSPLNLSNTLQALAAFQRTLISANSPFDRYDRGEDDAALSPAALRGLTLFESDRLKCSRCHAGVLFTDHVNWERKAFYTAPFHNTGLYDVDGKGAYPEPNTGQFAVTGNPRHMGRFKAPTLRNIAVTAPYMHDGSVPSLEAVIDHYAAGGRVISHGEHAGDGRKNPLKASFVTGFALTPDERADLLAFLYSLTDEAFLEDPALGDPWR